jgi:DNA-directed RNA polymerase specialized sigma24 family protein
MDDDNLGDIERYRNGDEDAAERLYARHAKFVLDLIRSKLPPVQDRPHIGSEDVRQEAFRSFFSAVKKPTFNPTQWNIVGLLVKIAKCKSYATFRKRRGPVAVDRDRLQYLIDVEQANRADGAACQAVVREWQELFERVLKLLPTWQKEVMAHVLDDQNEWTLDDIARMCDCDRIAVELAIKAFETKLREILRRLESGQEGPRETE